MTRIGTLELKGQSKSTNSRIESFPLLCHEPEQFFQIQVRTSGNGHTKEHKNPPAMGLHSENKIQQPQRLLVLRWGNVFVCSEVATNCDKRWQTCSTWGVNVSQDRSTDLLGRNSYAQARNDGASRYQPLYWLQVKVSIGLRWKN